jgi:hypothetical protein
MPDENNETSQLVDDDVVPEEYPPEQPYGVNERLTAAEEQGGESFDDRTRRTRPDRLGSDEGRVGQLIDLTDEDGVDVEPDAVAREASTAWRRDQLDPGDPSAGRDMTQDREEVIPAEEAAMHLTAEPPMGDGDGYIDE